MNDEEIARLAREGHGAIEVGLPVFKPLSVVIGGPIKHWWSIPQDQWDTHPAASKYFEWRAAVETALVKAGFLCYMPYKAIRGAWHESAQKINDMAIREFDVFLDLTPPGVPAEGTAAEIVVAANSGSLLVKAPPGDMDDLNKLINTLYDYKEFAPGLTNLIDNGR